MLDSGKWLLAKPLALGLVLMAAVAGGVAGVPAGDEMYMYMWRDPNFCNDCHVHDYANERWADSVHGQLTTCHDCHRVAIRHYPVNLYVTLFATPEVPEDIPTAEVQMVVCEQCHLRSAEQEPLTGPMTDELRVQIPKVDESPLHKLHLAAKKRMPSPYQGGTGEEPPVQTELDGERAVVCLDCHGGDRLDVHRFVAQSSMCEECHEGIRPKDKGGQPLECLDCHARGFGGSTFAAGLAGEGE
ncbi:hypothetical protein LBMAG42_23480 [Deltaproteobacteria bacterium]|nr:hypothetical protein LBMAG42_23480 [Deltaproteobacteria bacterium]